MKQSVDRASCNAGKPCGSRSDGSYLTVAKTAAPMGAMMAGEEGRRWEEGEEG